MVLKNISLSEVACRVCYFYLSHWGWAWPRIPVWGGRTDFALPALSVFTALIRSRGVDTLAPKEGETKPRGVQVELRQSQTDPAWLPSVSCPAPPTALPLTDMWHSCLHGQGSQALDGYRHHKMSCLNTLPPDLPPPRRFLPPGPPFILIIQWKLSSMESLPAVSHKPLIVLWTWIVAF